MANSQSVHGGSTCLASSAMHAGSPSRSPASRPEGGLRHRVGGLSVGSPDGSAVPAMPSSPTPSGKDGGLQVPRSLRSLNLSGDGDSAAGPVRAISLSSPGLLPKICCALPGAALFGLLGASLVAAALSQTVFHALTALLSILVFTWSFFMACGTMIGSSKMREANEVDWHAKLLQLKQDNPEATEGTHVLILPNYKEDEDMLLETLCNVGRAPIARDHLRVVLAMEAREGKKAQEKAERLIAKTSHMFAGIIASFHPADLPGEIAGKSSNTQWAFREMLRSYASVLGKFDPAQVYLTVGDADSLWHPQYFSGLEYQALMTPVSERQWTVYQPPVLLLRNLDTVPVMTRVSCYGTIWFEISGLGLISRGSKINGEHMAFSSYTVPLSMASHPLVLGWDKDVIAEDHHMYCKCYFASLWEGVQRHKGKHQSAAASTSVAAAPILPKVNLQPVFLPVISYLVESNDGYFASCYARFQQCRRHCQGIAELSYVVLQYVSLMQAVGFSGLPFAAHMGVWRIMQKMVFVHVINMVHAFVITLLPLLLATPLIMWLLSGGVANLWRDAALYGVAEVLKIHFGVDMASWSATWLYATFGPVPFLGTLMVIAAYIVIRDCKAGALSPCIHPIPTVDEILMPSMPACTQDVVSCGKAAGKRPYKASELSTKRCIQIFLQLQSDMWMAEPTIFLYGFIPALMAAWSLLRNGPQFEYIVAAKPV
eukprot:TRINITY_DN5872_c0_g1_i1.p1 TRINITY_DN5872_c0_g1~~TRINITY_DN5872_c0_g1_i1.p1  ORF type:complete len:713 (+),score=155.79 TRINITY_DN5872_c0_g1_i1:129-2267(+)